MNVLQAAKILEWVGQKKQWIVSDRLTQQQVAAKASEELGVKVSSNAARDAMLHHGIQRKSKEEARIDALQMQIDALKSLSVKLVTACHVPDWVLQESLAITNLSEEVRKAIADKAN
jgi:beta-phosphoglucomutase-like phosphatase (HAD superfamily)